MREVFADAGYWIAVLHPSERLHSLALRISDSLTPTKIITSENVLSEVLDFFAGFGALFRLKAVAFVEQLKTD